MTFHGHLNLKLRSPAKKTPNLFIQIGVREVDMAAVDARGKWDWCLSVNSVGKMWEIEILGWPKFFFLLTRLCVCAHQFNLIFYLIDWSILLKLIKMYEQLQTRAIHSRINCAQGKFSAFATINVLSRGKLLLKCTLSIFLC